MKASLSSQDVFIPWTNRTRNKKYSNGERGDFSVERYCHLYIEGEVESLVEKVEGLEVVKSFKDRANWVIEVEKKVIHKEENILLSDDDDEIIVENENNNEFNDPYDYECDFSNIRPPTPPTPPQLFLEEEEELNELVLSPPIRPQIKNQLCRYLFSLDPIIIFFFFLLTSSFPSPFIV